MVRSMLAITVAMVFMVSLATHAQNRGRPSRYLGAESLEGSGDMDGGLKQTRMREGAVLTNEFGKFKVTGDRITFYASDGNESYRTLENQALQRVAQVMEESREAREWSVNGVLTEFRGSNYLLLQRAVLKAKVANP